MVTMIREKLYTNILSEKDKQNLSLYTDDIYFQAYDELKNKNGQTYYRVPRYYSEELYNSVPLESRKYTEGFDIDLDILVKPRDDDQKTAIDSMINNDHGLVAATVGFGKTFVAISIICTLKKKTLIVVHNDTLFKQWKDKIEEYTGRDDVVGLIRGTKYELDKPICITTTQTLARRFDNREFIKSLYDANFGITFYDECHVTVGAPVFSRSINSIFSKRIYGLSATIFRTDGLTNLLEWSIGKPIYNNTNFKLDVTVAFVDILMPVSDKKHFWLTQFRASKSFNMNYTKMLMKDEFYLQSVANLIDLNIDAGREVLGLASMIDMLSLVYEKMRNKDKVSIIHAKVSKKDYTQQCILATFGVFKAGTDVPRLDTLVFMSPITAKVSLIQSIGRVCRQVKDKKPVIYDIVNSGYPYLNNLVNSRISTYSSEGFKMVRLKDINQINTLLESLK